MRRTDPMLQLKSMLKKANPKLSYKKDTNLNEWRNSLENKLKELLGVINYAPVLPNLRIKGEKKKDGYTLIRFTIATEEFFDMPCNLLLPDGVKNPPLIICLQGHSNGMHISIGEPKYQGDKEIIAGGRDFAIQAVHRGKAALCLEQRYFGERRTKNDVPGTECWVPSMTELMLGRSALAGRVWDISRALDVIEKHFQYVDLSRVGLMGNSGGGTATWYAACLESRISAIMSSCSVCTYAKSIAVIKHCMDQHIPGALNWFEMGDLAGLIAPRPLVIVAGRNDDIFPLEGVYEAYQCIQEIYTAFKAENACRLVIGEGGHRFYPEQAWQVFSELTGW